MCTLCYSQVYSRIGMHAETLKQAGKHIRTLTHKHTHTRIYCSKPSEGAHQSGNAITQSKYSLPPLFSHTAKQSLKLPSVADQQSIHKQQQTTLPTFTVPEDIFLICQEDGAV